MPWRQSCWRASKQSEERTGRWQRSAPSFSRPAPRADPTANDQTGFDGLRVAMTKQLATAPLHSGGLLFLMDGQSPRGELAVVPWVRRSWRARPLLKQIRARRLPSSSTEKVAELPRRCDVAPSHASSDARKPTGRHPSVSAHPRCRAIPARIDRAGGRKTCGRQRQRQ